MNGESRYGMEDYGSQASLGAIDLCAVDAIGGNYCLLQASSNRA
jgi:hypothetical protein